MRACVRASPNGETIYMLPYDECKNIGYRLYIYIYICIYNILRNSDTFRVSVG